VRGGASLRVIFRFGCSIATSAARRATCQRAVVLLLARCLRRPSNSKGCLARYLIRVVGACSTHIAMCTLKTALEQRHLSRQPQPAWFACCDRPCFGSLFSVQCSAGRCAMLRAVRALCNAARCAALEGRGCTMLRNAGEGGCTIFCICAALKANASAHTF